MDLSMYITSLHSPWNDIMYICTPLITKCPLIVCMIVCKKQKPLVKNSMFWIKKPSPLAVNLELACIGGRGSIWPFKLLNWMYILRGHKNMPKWQALFSYKTHPRWFVKMFGSFPKYNPFYILQLHDAHLCFLLLSRNFVRAKLLTSL